MDVDNTFYEIKRFSQEKTIEIETEVEKTILYVSPLLFIFFTSKTALNEWSFICIIFLLVSMITSLINLTILRNLFAKTINNAFEGESIQNDLKTQSVENVHIENLNNKVQSLGVIRNWFNGVFKLSILFFILSIISLIFFIFNQMN